MSLIKVVMKSTGEPVKRLPIVIRKDGSQQSDMVFHTDRYGCVELEGSDSTGNVSIGGRSYYQGSLNREILVEIWSMTSGGSGAGIGAPAGIGGGSIAYPSMQIDHVMVNNMMIETCSEGYIVNPEQWSEDFALALADKEGLVLSNEHWEVIRYLREYYSTHHVQCTVRDMIKYFRKTWGREKGSNKYLHKIFPCGGPQKQGNRLAGLLRTKGEH